MTELRTAVTALLLAAAAAGCGGHSEVACPAIAWTNAVTVRWADPPASAAAGTVEVTCPEVCSWTVTLDGPAEGSRTVTAPLDDGAAVVGIDMSTPDSVTVAVLAADGTVLSGFDADLDWVRTGGSAECGGPSVATVDVPA